MMKNKLIRMIAILIACTFVIGLTSVPALAVSDEASSSGNTYKTVRIGWYQSSMFQEGESDSEEKSGYCYDYMQKVADYTSWKFEYVYGNCDELFNKLQRGEIDFLGGVSKTEERKKDMLFPKYAMGTDQYYLFKRMNDADISADNISSLNGKVIGGISNNRMTVMAEKWIKENNLNVKIINYKGFDEQEKAFENGKVDLIVQTINNVLNMSDIDVISKVGEEPFYMAVNKNKKELLTELNDSLGKMISIDPFILQNLQYKNYGTNFINRTLTDSERKWISRHDAITVGYMDNYMPYAFTDLGGKATGLMTDVLDAIMESLKLKDSLIVEYKTFADYDGMVDALKKGEVQIIFPVNSNMWDLEQDGINSSTEVVTCSEAFFYKGKYKKENVKKIAVNENNNLEEAYCRRTYPEAVQVKCSSLEECLEMVVDGYVDGTLVNMLRTEIVTRNRDYDSLSYVQLKNEDTRCFGVNEGDIELLTILNRGLRIIGSSYGIENAYKYMDELYKYDVFDFFRDNIIMIVLIAGVIVAIIIILLVRGLKKKAMEVKHKEELIRQANELNIRIESLKDKADRANAAKTLFLNNISHDIRTPMNAIIGYTDIALNNTDNPKTNKYLGKIRESSEHLLSLINDVLDINRIESGAVKINSEVTDISKVTEEAFNISNGFLAGRNLNLEFKKIEKASPLVVADALKIREILVNILGNAIKFTDDGGSVRLVYELRKREEGKLTVRYEISDTGKGMSEEFQDHIFEEFAQENNGARTQYKGTGLGLAISKKYIDLMGGNISFKSKLGEGTTFFVEFPLVCAGEAVPKASKSEEFKVNVRGLGVLLAEDNDLNAEIAQIQLEEAGMVTKRAVDGKEVVEIFRNNPTGSFDVILMDILMPNMNGYEATKEIREMVHRPDGAKIPIIAMTANAFSEDVKMSYDAGMTAHLTKPVKSEELIRVIAENVRKESSES